MAAVQNVLGVLLPAAFAQAEAQEVCPACLLQNLATTMLLNVGLKFLHEGQEKAWLEGVQDVIQGIHLAHTEGEPPQTVPHVTRFH